MRLRIGELDLLLARLGCIFSIPVSIYIYLAFNPRYVSVGIIVFVVCLLYILARRKRPPNAFLEASATSKVYLALNILFFSLLAYSIVAYYFRPEQYVRPLGYFIATALMVAVLAVEILLLPEGRKYERFALGKIIITSISLVWTISLLYPSLLGVDPWYHCWFTEYFLANGHPPVGQHYSMLPGMHLVIGGTSVVTGLSYKMASLVSASLIQVVLNPLFIFLIGKHIYNEKVGLLGALVLSVANYHIMFSYWIVPNSLAMAFILPIAYLLMKVRQEKRIVGTITLALLILMVVVTHTMATFMLAIVVLLMWVGYFVYQKMRGKVMKEARAFLVTSLVVITAGVSFTLIASGHIETIIALVKSGFDPSYFSPLSVVGVPSGEQFFNYLGFSLFCGLGFIGIVAMFYKDIINGKGFALAITGMIVLVFTGVAFMSQRTVILGRWCHLAQILLAIPIGVLLVWLGGMKKKILNICLIGLLVFVLAFLMIVSPQENMDNRTFGPNTIVRSAFTQEELDALNEVSEEWDGKIAVDMSYYAMRRFYWGQLYDMSPNLVSRNFSECEGMVVLVRDSIMEEPCKIDGYGIVHLDYDPGEALKEQGFLMVYKNGSVRGYAREV